MMSRPASLLLLSTLLLLPVLPAPLSAATPADQRPNIVFIIGDDVGRDDLGCYGNPHIRTPNLDRLAARSTVFDNAYLTASSCSPSRCSIITGRYPHNLESAAELHAPLANTVVTFPQLLRAAGYYTAHAGKTHFGSNTRTLEGAARKAFVDGGSESGQGAKDGNGGEGQWIDRLRNRPAGRPFFMWFASFDSHRGWNADTFSGLNRPADVVVPPYLADTPETRADLASYYDEITRLDHFVGEVLLELERQKVLDHTIIIFTSDNGRPFPHSKTQLFDDGIKTPLLIFQPGRPAGGRTAALVSAIDYAPTILALAGLPASPTMQGVSLLPLLHDPQATVRDYVFAEHNWHDYPAHVRLVRTGDFVYLRNAWPDLQQPGATDTYASPSANALRALRARDALTPLQAGIFLAPRPAEELYDLSADPGETTNLVTTPSSETTLARLRNVMSRWQQETGDSVPPLDGRTAVNGDYTTGALLVPVPQFHHGIPPGAATRALTITRPGPIRAEPPP